MSNQLFLGHDADGGAYTLKADRLTTHGVVVGMTGSGKTGLSIVMLEELIAAGVPLVCIDPKGDLGNLALLFPDFAASDFAPYAGDQDPAALAAQWKAGIERTGLDADKVRGLRDRLDLRLYTPGSRAGRPVDLLSTFARPDGDLGEEARIELVSTAVSGLFGLLGEAKDPVRDPEHIVLSRILSEAWAAGEDIDLSTMILRLVDPPFAKVGVFPTDAFFPPKDRMGLAMQLNAVLAAPGFETWSAGAPLDVADMLRRTPGRTRVSVFCLSHLSEAERQFFLGILLGKLLAHTRTMPGSGDLEALLFFDEVAGFLPPHPHNPATKAPLLTMMKQARAVGFGVVLSTQNPVDLDYKALSNAGLWCIGRLSTQQDRDRLLKGLGRPDLDDEVRSLDKRQFVMSHVKDDAPQVVASRHAMCFLKGPFTRVELEQLTAGQDAAGPAQPAASTTNPPAAPGPAPAAGEDAAGLGGLLAAAPHIGPARFVRSDRAFAAKFEGRFAEGAEPPRPDGRGVYRPAFYVRARLRFDEDRAGFVLDEEHVRVFDPVSAEEGDAVALTADDWRQEPEDGALFVPLPDELDTEQEAKAKEKRAVQDIYNREARGMFVHKKLKLAGRAGETREAFAERVKAAIQERVDDEVAKLRDKTAAKLERLEDKLRDEERRVAELSGVVRTKQAEEVVNLGETVWSLFTGGRKSVSSAVKKRGQSARAAARLDKSEDKVAALRADIDELETELAEKVENIEFEQLALLDEIEQKEVRLEKSDIEVLEAGILWIPATRRI